MRLLGRWRLPGLGLAAVVAAASFFAGGAQAENTYGPKVDDVVARLVAENPSAPLNVVVYGSKLSTVNRKLNLTPTHLLDEIGAESVTIPASLLPALVAESGVRYIAADAGIAPHESPGDPVDRIHAWLVNTTPIIDGATRAWVRGYTGKDVGIAVIDTGAVNDSKTFGGRLTQSTYDNQQNGHANDKVGHGTFISSIAGGFNGDARFAGIAPLADIYVLNVARPDGAYTSDVLAALRWVLRKHDTKKNIRVVALSLTELVPSRYNANALNAMVEKLWRAGITVVVSAGNGGPGSAVYAPANDPFVISVGALDDAGTLGILDDAETAWSTSGTTLDGHTRPDILAPGRLVMGLLPAQTILREIAPAENLVGPELALMSGTSFSAPQVAGAAALLVQAHPQWTPDQIKWVLMNTARAVPYGTAGALDVLAAVSYQGTPGSANQGIPYSDFALPSWSTTDYETRHDGNGWTGNGWTGKGWNGNGWTGNGWTGNGWTWFRR